MYHRIIEQCAGAVERIGEWLDKAERHAEAKKFEIQRLLDWRLAPDMGGFTYQVQSASDYLKGGAAWLSGQVPPSYQDDERNIADVRERIRKTVAFARSIEPGQFTAAAGRIVKVSWIPDELDGETYLVKVVVPNIDFHVSMAYAILRQAGVDVGKRDYLGPIYRPAK